MNGVSTVPVWIWPLFALAIVQGWWIFRDAKRRGYNPWLWGALGLLNIPSSLIVYLLVVNHLERNKKEEDRHDPD